MAVGAQRTGGDVRDILARGNRAVMAGRAGARDLRVINTTGGLECRSHVTTLAGIGCGDVCGVLASGTGAVVATEAITGDAIVTEVRRLPRRRRVATTAVRSGNDMPGRLAGGSGAVVARGAAAGHLRVINLGSRFPHSRCMTALAGVARQNMRGVLAGGAHAVVATRTTTGNTGVIKPSGLPRQRAMASLAAVR